LSIRQPWAWAILHAGKDVENRSWRTSYRGPLLIHASKRVEAFSPELIRYMGMRGATIEQLAEWLDLPTGGIVGVVDVVGCSRGVNGSCWAMSDQWHWELANPRVLPFEPMKGRLGLWEPER
jgi:hypothetical protein